MQKTQTTYGASVETDITGVEMEIENNRKEYFKEYYLNNKDKAKEYHLNNKDKRKEYELNNREKRKEYQKKYTLNNKERRKKYQKKYTLNNKEKRKEYRLNNIEKINKQQQIYRKNRCKIDPNFRIANCLRVRLAIAIKGIIKSKSTLKLLGCTIEQLWIHLEKLFQPRMTKENHGLWHIDHIKPCASFDLTNPKQQSICFHYTNLQPLWAQDNLSKGARYES